MGVVVLELSEITDFRQVINAAVADMRNPCMLFAKHQRHAGGAHARTLLMRGTVGKHRLVCGAEGLLQAARHSRIGRLEVGFGDGAHRHVARQFAGALTAHPVGHDKELHPIARLSVRGGREMSITVLVFSPDHADMRRNTKFDAGFHSCLRLRSPQGPHPRRRSDGPCRRGGTRRARVRRCPRASLFRRPTGR